MNDICNNLKSDIMAMNKNTVLAWATFIMVFVGLGLIALGVFRYKEVAGWGFRCGWSRFFCYSMGFLML